jgi:decaprenylphospho-beta-D-erythro-pentofuranosid-2-ulose 2-reductase
MENAFGQPQRVVVLGGSSEIARAIARRLVAARARTVVLGGRSRELLDTAAAELTSLGATAAPSFLFDAEDPASAGDAVATAFELAGGPVDLVIIAVGLLGDQAVDQDDPVAAARVATVNFTWPVAALAALRPRMLAQGAGRILVLSSVAGVRVRASAYLYGGAKAGLDRLCQGYADSLAGTGVTLQLVRPGFVRTKMTTGRAEAPFAVGPEDVADDVLAGLGSRTAVITSPPVLRYLFMILRHLPAPLWRKVAERA